MQARKTTRRLTLSALAVAIVLGSGADGVVAQVALDLCGCAGIPDLPAFDASDPSTYPPGTTGGCATVGCASSDNLTLPLPPDGVLRFSSFRAVSGSGCFTRFLIYFAETGTARTNTPVTLLVSGDLTLGGSGCGGYDTGLIVSGGAGSAGNSAGVSGLGGAGGPGGFRGGDAAAYAVNGAAYGGAGQGPGGGAGAAFGVPPMGGTFFGVPELLPLVGGSGGGGGGTTSAEGGTACTGGGGGGGGGAILIAVNGTLSMTNSFVGADGGSYSNPGSTSCAYYGAGGAGGAIRLVANRFVGSVNALLYARGGSGAGSSPGGSPGRIRLESLDSSAQTAFQPQPSTAALRITGPGPLTNPVAPSVAITQVTSSEGTQVVPTPPQGYRGAVDLTLPAPGVVNVDVATTGVPSGTTVAVTAKPRIGGVTQTQTVELTNCNAQGVCTATAPFTLNAGMTFLEARATFQVP